MAARNRSRIKELLRWATRTWRGRFALVALLLAAGAAGTYSVLVLSTISAPPPAHLESAPILGSNPVPTIDVACARTSQPLATDDGTPDGQWVVAGQSTGGFVGYRATEILAFEFVRAPNDAVGRTHDVEGHLLIAGEALTAATVDVRVDRLASDVDMRDGHIYNYLKLQDHAHATFVLAEPAQLGAPVVGKVVTVDAIGDLTIMEVSHRVTFPLEARWNGDSVDVAGHLTINRADYAMDIPQLLGFRVGEQITIELSLRFVREGADPCVAPVASPGADGTPSIEPTIAPPNAVALHQLPEDWGEIILAGLPNPPGQSAPQGELYVLRGGDSEPTALTHTATGIEDEPAWSADGRQIVYTLSPPESAISLWIANADGSGAEELPGTFDRTAAWAPDGATIAAIVDTDLGSSLVLFDVSSRASRVVLADSGVPDSPTWSPDGRHLAFALIVPGGSSEDIYVADPSGGNLHQITSDPAYEYQPKWSPDGGDIAFVRGGDLWIMGADGGNQRQITQGLTVDSPTWSPDGRHLAFVIAGDGPLNEGPQRSVLWFVDADGSNLSNLTVGLYLVAHPAWRP